MPELALPQALLAAYGGGFGVSTPRVFANFVASLDGIVALPGDTESGQVISGRNPADRFVMGMLRACADAVLLGAGTFRKSAGHAWHAERIYPAAASLFADARQRLGFLPQPRLVLVSASGSLDASEPALKDAWLFTTKVGAAKLQRTLPSSTRVTVLDTPRIAFAEVVSTLQAEGYRRVLTEGGPSLFSELVHERLVDELFLTSSPALFGRFGEDHRKALTEGLDLQGASLELSSVRRHGSHLFLRYEFDYAKAVASAR